jgi:hypothetical protein
MSRKYLPGAPGRCLLPMTPLYNSHKVWKLLESGLRKYDLAIQHNFAIRPNIYLASQYAGARMPSTATT